MASLILNTDFPVLQRKEMYFGRTTPVIRWLVWINGKVLAECKTKKEAQKWLDLYK